MNPDYYFADLWGDRMIKRCTPLGDGPPPETLPATIPGGICYEILFSEVVSRKGKGYAEDKSEFTLYRYMLQSHTTQLTFGSPQWVKSIIAAITWGYQVGGSRRSTSSPLSSLLETLRH